MVTAMLIRGAALLELVTVKDFMLEMACIAEVRVDERTNFWWSSIVFVLGKTCSRRKNKNQ